LFDMVAFAKQDLMLIPIKAFTNHGTKLFPGNRVKLRLDGLVPTGSRALKVHLGNTDPHVVLSAIHREILLATFTPTAGVLTIEGRKRQLRQAAEIGMIVILWWNMWVLELLRDKWILVEHVDLVTGAVGVAAAGNTWAKESWAAAVVVDA
jgi:hypothetical protein